MFAAGPAFFANAGPANDPFYANVSLLLHCDGTNGGTVFTDNSSVVNTITRVGTANTSNTQARFGATSLQISGTSGLDITAGTQFDMTGDYTIEFWTYHTSIAINQTIYDGRTAAGAGSGPVLFMNAGGTMEFFDSATRFTFAYPSTNAWHFWAWSRSGSTTRLFLDGTLVNSYAVLNNLTGMRPAFGLSCVSTQPMVGFMDDIRVTKGVARYTANFSSPTAAFPNS